MLFSSPDTVSCDTANPTVRKAVLFVDDEKSYLELMAQLLGENLNCTVLTYTRPEDAMAALPGLDAAMIITDYYMPSMNGLELTQRASEIAPNVPVIMVTGHTIQISEEDYLRYPNLKVALHKPFSWRMLAQQIIQHWREENPPALPADYV